MQVTVSLTATVKRSSYIEVCFAFKIFKVKVFCSLFN